MLSNMQLDYFDSRLDLPRSGIKDTYTSIAMVDTKLHQLPLFQPDHLGGGKKTALACWDSSDLAQLLLPQPGVELRKDRLDLPLGFGFLSVEDVLHVVSFI